MPSSARPARGELLYTAAAVLALLVVFTGFARTFYLKGLYGTPELPALPIIHGLVMSCWFILFLIQTRLVASGQIKTHRLLGALSGILATAMVILGVSLAIWAARRGHTPGPPPILFTIIPFSSILGFLILISCGFYFRNRKETHKRLMLLASLAMLDAAVARIPLDFVHNGGPLVYFGLVNLLILVCVAIDTIQKRRLHPAFGWGAGLLLLSVPLRLWLMGTPAYLAFATWVVR